MRIKGSNCGFVLSTKIGYYCIALFLIYITYLVYEEDRLDCGALLFAASLNLVESFLRPEERKSHI